jgi:hypothetical protein
MAVAEKIYQYVKGLPPALQAEVLDFIEYLLAKFERERSLREESLAWSEFSLESAMRDMESEEGPPYTVADLKVRFQ